jgi:L,D-transpeptidase YcbB
VENKTVFGTGTLFPTMRSRFWRRGRTGLFSAVALIAVSGFTLAASAQTLPLPEAPDTADITARDFQTLAREAAPVETLTLPALPDVVATFDTPANTSAGKVETAEKPVEAPVILALPVLPEPDLPGTVLASGAAAKPEMTTGSVVSDAFKLDLPDLPAVKLSVAPLRLDLTEDKLRALLQDARQKYRLKPSEIDSFVAAYSGRDFRAIWLTGENADLVVSPKAAALRDVLAKSEANGLDANRLLAVLPLVRSGKVSPEKHVATDIDFSLAAFIYARDLRGGRLEPSRLSALMTPSLELPEAQALLTQLAASEPAGVDDVLLAYEPQHAGYQALKVALARLREERAAPVLTGTVAGINGAPHPEGTLPPNWLDGPALGADKADSRVPLLRQRLGLAPSTSEIYDADLRKAVQNFQRANHLKANGIITPRTRAALENPAAPLNEADRKPDLNATLSAVLANMERWRWLPANLGETHVFVNIADFQLKVVDHTAIIHQTRVIVGRPQTQTPIFSDQMEHVIVNPSWGVPSSIIKKEFLPKMASDPDYAAKRGYTVVRRGNQISIRQPPGARNALGYIKFIFPNQHSVYMHDTPSRNLFQSDMRAFSHGCVRVYQPFSLADKLLSSQGYSESQLKAMIGRGERMIRLKDKIPVHLAYFTVFVDDKGEIQQRRDIYGHDARIRTALHL